ncbi:protein of unknown function DUF159 [Methylocella silvestris BL2]|uniref:Abasic site processing protein n=1 Tax=Methylocella silvestris (strain DSM 15510 / CIP 108128 / LMG 27833 / NCIMB 13906 / BL2) TaxID=395965 RepID=B8EL82_METSB|nr:SOS response-associated peptidase [Methylocella silvestris]ACK49077.1 protein of unknown function DUF159 [Methylocella silvestris BL2]
MCGRFAMTSPPEATRRFFGYLEQPNFPPRYNIAPTQPVPIVRGRFDADHRLERCFDLVRWEFLPRFAKDPRNFPLIINARAETLLEKPSFAAAFRRRRCLFIADAFYEWRREAGSRGRGARPYLFRRADGAPLALGGIWESWCGPNGEELDTACIITTAANGSTAAIHDRLPAIIARESFETWLCPDEATTEAALSQLRPPENDALEFFAIGPEVNKAANDYKELQEPVAGAAPPSAPAQQDDPPQQLLF